MTRQKRVYSAEFKRDAIDLWQSTERSARQVEEELGLTPGILYKWKQKLRADGAEAFPGQGRLKASDEQMRRLERELAIVKQERDILKKQWASSVHQTATICDDRTRTGVYINQTCL